MDNSNTNRPLAIAYGNSRQSKVWSNKTVLFPIEGANSDRGYRGRVCPVE